MVWTFVNVKATRTTRMEYLKSTAGMSTTEGDRNVEFSRPEQLSGGRHRFTVKPRKVVLYAQHLEGREKWRRIIRAKHQHHASEHDLSREHHTAYKLFLKMGARLVTGLAPTYKVMQHSLSAIFLIAVRLDYERTDIAPLPQVRSTTTT